MALLSDALESIINVVAAGSAIIALTISARPADASHPYGHSKAEYFSAAIEGALVLVAAASIFREAHFGWLDPQAPSAPFAGMAINGLATCINLVWALFLIRKGRAWRSPALVAGGQHVLTDVWTSGGVLVGFALVPLTGWLRFDPAIAALVAVNILWTGYAMLRDAAGGLMDKAAEPGLLAQIRTAIATQATGAIEAHDVRTRQSGRTTFIEFHLVVPGELTVREAHGIADRIEAGLREALGEAVITIHVEPAENAKRRGVLVLP